MATPCGQSRESCLVSSKAWLKENIIMVATMVAVVLGLTLGFGLRLVDPSPEQITWISIWGELFLRMLKMIVLPLTVCCLVVGVASMDSTTCGKVGGITLAYVFSTHIIAVLLGVILVLAIKPGAGFHDKPPELALPQDVSYTDVFGDLLRNLIPENMIQACIQTAYTDVTADDIPMSTNITPHRNITSQDDMNTVDLYNVSGLVNDNVTVATIRKLMYRDKMNIIGIVVLSVAFGVSISVAGPAGKPLYSLMVSLHDVIFIIMKAIIWYSPLGILSLIAGAICKIEDLSNAIQAVGLLLATVIAGCMIHQFVILPLILAVICRRNPFTFMLGIADAVMAAIAPPASVASMPAFLSGLPTKFGLDKRVVDFVIPINVTINRDGSILFVAVVCLFCAQSYGIVLSAGHIVVFCILSTVMIIAVASVPSSSIMVVILLCSAFNIPSDDRIGLFMAVDWLLDRIRTGTNVVSHGFGCAIVDKLAQRFLKTCDDAEHESDVNELKETELAPDDYKSTQKDGNQEMTPLTQHV